MDEEISRIYAASLNGDRLKDGDVLNLGRNVNALNDGDTIVVTLPGGHERTLFVEKDTEGALYVAHVKNMISTHIRFAPVGANCIKLEFDNHFDEIPEAF